MIKRILKLILSDKTKRSIKEQLGVPGLHHSLQLLKKRGYAPRFVIDGGAYEGQWTLDLLEVFPDASVLMLEAQSSKATRLQQIVEQCPKVIFHQALLSAEDGTKLVFKENETASHVESVAFGGEVGIYSEAIDAIISRRGLPFPDFIKLDVQGYELEVLRGATACLAHAEFCLLEISLLNLGNEPLLAEVIAYMDDRGFQAYDICQFMRRPYDLALYQIDMLFVNKTSKFIADKRWQ